VDPAQVLVLILHPIAALMVIREFVLQRDWRKKGLELKGRERASELRRHEIEGERLFRLVIAVIGLAFIARLVSASLSGENVGYDDLLPGHFHGWGGVTRTFVDDISVELGPKGELQERQLANHSRGRRICTGGCRT